MKIQLLLASALLAILTSRTYGEQYLKTKHYPPDLGIYKNLNTQVLGINVSNKPVEALQVNGNVRLDSGPLQLALLAADPAAATDGMMYYNTAMNKFRICEGGAWKNITTGSIKSYYKVSRNEDVINLGPATWTMIGSGWDPFTDMSITFTNTATANYLIAFHAKSCFSALGFVNSVTVSDLSFEIDGTMVEGGLGLAMASYIHPIHNPPVPIDPVDKAAETCSFRYVANITAGTHTIKAMTKSGANSLYGPMLMFVMEQ